MTLECILGISQLTEDSMVLWPEWKRSEHHEHRCPSNLSEMCGLAEELPSQGEQHLGVSSSFTLLCLALGTGCCCLIPYGTQTTSLNQAVPHFAILEPLLGGHD